MNFYDGLSIGLLIGLVAWIFIPNPMTRIQGEAVILDAWKRQLKTGKFPDDWTDG